MLSSNDFWLSFDFWSALHNDRVFLGPLNVKDLVSNKILLFLFKLPFMYSPPLQTSPLMILTVTPFRITIGWKTRVVPKNLGNSHDDGHWNFPIWTKGSWENDNKRFQLAFLNHVYDHFFSQSVTENNRLCFGGP